MENYTDLENIQKAKEVRRLIKISITKRDQGLGGEGELKEARRLSKELVEYLKTNYSNSFRTFWNHLPINDWNIIRDYFVNNNEKGKEILEEIMKRKGIKIHDILFIRESGENSWNPRTLAIFFDDNGPHEVYIRSNSEPEGPDAWYDFTERMGLLPYEAGYLYNTDIVFYNREDKWPIQESKEKL